MVVEIIAEITRMDEHNPSQKVNRICLMSLYTEGLSFST